MYVTFFYQGITLNNPTTENTYHYSHLACSCWLQKSKIDNFKNIYFHLVGKGLHVNVLLLRAFSKGQSWPARPVILKRNSSLFLKCKLKPINAIRTV